MLHRSLLAAAILSVAATAHAADAVVDIDPAPLPASVTHDWSGLYAGLHAGYVNGDQSVPQTLFQAESVFGGATDVLAGGTSSDGDGFVGGVHLGYREQSGSFVYGGVFEADLATLDEGYGRVTQGFGIDLDGGSFDVDATARAMALAGVAFDRTLLYAQGGLAWMDGQARTTQIDGFGYAVGAGIDYAVSGRITLGVDYLYQDFDDLDRLSVDNPNGRTLPSQDVDIDLHTVRLKLAVRF